MLAANFRQLRQCSCAGITRQGMAIDQEVVAIPVGNQKKAVIPVR
jgi:hypothetical protein